MQAQKKAEEEEYTRLEREAAEVTAREHDPFQRRARPQRCIARQPGRTRCECPEREAKRVTLHSARFANAALLRQLKPLRHSHRAWSWNKLCETSMSLGVPGYVHQRNSVSSQHPNSQRPKSDAVKPVRLGLPDWHFSWHRGWFVTSRQCCHRNSRRKSGVGAHRRHPELPMLWCWL